MARARKRVFVSFRAVEPDRTIAEQIATEASSHHDVFFAPAIPPASDWGKAIQEALDSADVFVVIASSALLEGGEMVRAEVERAVQRRRQSQSPTILPVRLRQVQLPYPWSAYLNPHQAISWNDNEDTASVLDAVRRILSDGEIPRPTPKKTLTRLEQMFSNSARGVKMRAAIIERVRHDWIEGVLNRSLYALARIEVRLMALPAPARLVVRIPAQDTRVGELLPEGSRIQRVFDDHLGQLLILGIPGVGKTTLILELAEDLLAWSAADDNRPIPVVLNLSSWRSEQQLFESWLVDELNRSYDVPRQIARQLINAEGLILLLDGLDEVKPESRNNCVTALNQFREAHGTVPFALSSRMTEFVALSSELRIRAAVVVQPLERSDVETFINRDGDVQQSIRRVLVQDPALWEMLDTPLMLSIVAISSQVLNHSVSPAVGAESRRRVLWERYVYAVLTRRSGSLPYDFEQVVSSLSWLARRMQALGRTVFHLEDLNRDWLQTKADTFIISIGMTCAVWLTLPFAWNWDWLLKGSLRPEMAPVRAIALALTAFLTFRPAATARGSWTRLRDGLVFAAATYAVALLTARDLSPASISAWAGFSIILGGVALLLFWRPRGPGLEAPTESFVWHWRSAWRGALWAALLAMPFGVGIGLQSDVRTDPDSDFGTMTPIMFALFTGVSAALLFIPFAGWRTAMPDEQRSPNAGFRRSLRNAVYLPMVLCVISVAFALWLDRHLSGYWYSLLLGIPVAWGFLRGGLFCIQNLLVRVVLWRRGHTPWRYAAFLDIATQHLILRKVGGGYVFVHRTLLDYLASLDARDRVHEPVALATDEQAVRRH